jgi:hypothetical protein
LRRAGALRRHLALKGDRTVFSGGRARRQKQGGHQACENPHFSPPGCAQRLPAASISINGRQALTSTKLSRYETITQTARVTHLQDQSEPRSKTGTGTAPVLILIMILLSAHGVGLNLMGRPLFCACSSFSFWTGDIRSPETSQLFVDWYSFTHIEHGLIFYFLGWLLLPRLSIEKRFLVALAIEVAWEMLENSAWFVQIYRQQALAAGYSGDSVVNSVSDLGFMSLGYFIAARAPTGASVALLLAIEGALAYVIRDSLALNLLNFVHPFDAVARWQSRAP